MKRPAANVESRAAPISPANLRAAICLLLALVTALVYAGVRRFEFINLDDWQYVSSNPYVQAGLTREGIAWAFGSTYASNWHPVTWMSHMLDCQLFGRDAGWHHVSNLVLHIGATVMLFLAFERMTRSPWRSACVAALFALHPLHVESVAWVAERKDVLSGFFFMLTLWAYAGFAGHREQGTSSVRRAWYGLAVVFCALGLMSKPMLVTLPFVLLLLDYWPLGRLQRSTMARRLLEKSPFFALAAVSSWLTLKAQHAAVVNLTHLPFPARAANAVVAYASYLGKVFWPVHLAVPYPHPLQLPILPVVAAAVLLLFVSAITLLAAKQRPYLAVGWLWFLGMLVPVIGLVQVGTQAMADRYTYLPIIGVFVALVWLAADLAESDVLRQRVAAAGAVFVCLLCAWLAHRQASWWHDSIRLFTHTLAVAPPSAIAHDNLGAALFKRGDIRAAKTHFEAALLLQPPDPASDANLGMVLLEEGKYDDAITHFERSLQFGLNGSEAENNWGVALLRQGKLTEARTHFERAIQRNPFHGDARANLGFLLAGMGELDAAREQFETALRCKADFPEALNGLGSVLVRQGRARDAAPLLESALRLRPNYADAHSNLGNVALALGQRDAAFAEYQTAVRLNPKHGPALCQLANLLAASGQSSAAEANYRASLAAVPNNAETHYQLAILLATKKEFAECAQQYREAVRLKPDWVEAHNNLGWLLATTADDRVRDPDQAVIFSTRAVELTRTNDAEALDTLAAAYASQRRFDAAIANALHALDLISRTGPPALASGISNRLELYRAGQAYREP